LHDLRRLLGQFELLAVLGVQGLFVDGVVVSGGIVVLVLVLVVDGELVGGSDGIVDELVEGGFGVGGGGGGSGSGGDVIAGEKVGSEGSGGEGFYVVVGAVAAHGGLCVLLYFFIFNWG